VNREDFGRDALGLLTVDVGIGQGKSIGQLSLIP
jgi:hypothetical protein